MNICEELKEEHIKMLKDLAKAWKGKAISLREDNSIDEAVFEQIKVNVVEIFEKLFNISYNRACKNSDSDIDNCRANLKKLYCEYMNFFDKIPSPWREKASKDKEHKLMEDYYKEQIKLNTADQIKTKFLESYERFSR